MDLILEINIINLKVDRLTSFEGNPSFVGFMLALELTASSFIDRNCKTQFIFHYIRFIGLKRKTSSSRNTRQKEKDEDIHLNLMLQRLDVINYLIQNKCFTNHLNRKEKKELTKENTKAIVSLKKQNSKFTLLHPGTKS